MITGVAIENSKRIGDRVELKIHPITLLLVPIVPARVPRYRFCHAPEVYYGVVGAVWLVRYHRNDFSSWWFA